MEAVKKRIISAVIICLSIFIFYRLTEIVFAPIRTSHEKILKMKKLKLLSEKELISKKAEYETQWEKVSDISGKDQTPDENLNVWVKDLLNYSNTEGLAFTKLEPQGPKEIGNKQGKEQEIKVLLSFDGDIRQLIHFIYYLLEQDPFSEIKSLSMKQDSASKSFNYEITLRKTVF